MKRGIIINIKASLCYISIGAQLEIARLTKGDDENFN